MITDNELFNNIVNTALTMVESKQEYSIRHSGLEVLRTVATRFENDNADDRASVPVGENLSNLPKRIIEED